MDGAGELRSLIKVWITVIVSLTFCYFIARKIPKGIMRLLSLLPIVTLFTYLPLYLSSLHFIGICMLFLTWLGNFKLLLFAMDRGPLSSDNPSISLLRFISIGCLPVHLKQQNGISSPSEITKRGLSSPLNYTVKILLFALLIKTYDYKPFMPLYLILILYCFHIYLLVEVILAIAAVPVRLFLGFEIEAQFNDPYFSTSLQDFWGRRWNLMVSRIMRDTVYNPLRNISKPIVGRTCALLVGSMGTFIVSGLMHELLFFYLSRVRPSWEVTCFFILQGVCTSLEVAVKYQLVNKWKLHPVISAMLTIGFVAVTGFWLFLPQLLRNEVDTRMIEECGVVVKFITRLVKF